MPNIDFTLINYWAVLAAGVCAFLIGGVWYTALFGKAWARLHGYTPEHLAAMRAKRPMPIFLGMMMACCLVIAFAIAVMFLQLNVRMWSTGAKVGIAIWIIVAAVSMTHYVASNKPFGAYLIDVSHELVYFIAMGAIIGGWR